MINEQEIIKHLNIIHNYALTTVSFIPVLQPSFSEYIMEYFVAYTSEISV